MNYEGRMQIRPVSSVQKHERTRPPPMHFGHEPGIFFDSRGRPRFWMPEKADDRPSHFLRFEPLSSGPDAAPARMAELLDLRLDFEGLMKEVRHLMDIHIYAEAEPLLEKALRLQPRRVQAVNYMIIVKGSQRKSSEARNYYDKAVRGGFANEWTYYDMIKAYASERLFGFADNILRAAERHKMDNNDMRQIIWYARHEKLI